MKAAAASVTRLEKFRRFHLRNSCGVAAVTHKPLEKKRPGANVAVLLQGGLKWLTSVGHWAMTALMVSEIGVFERELKTC